MNAIRKHITIDNSTGKMDVDTQPENIKLTNEDFFSALKIITPTSLRGIDINKPTINWNDLMGLEEGKKEFNEIHTIISKQLKSSIITQRPSLLNLIIEGKKGAGKRTFIYAFAKQYNYEVLELDFLDLSSETITEAYYNINEIIAKAKQIAPAIVYITNAERSENSESFLYKVVNELHKLNKYIQIMTVLSVEDKKLLPTSILGYKGFVRTINIDQPKDNIKKIIIDKYGNKIDKIDNISFESIGQAITAVQEQIEE